jgi:hypothetical protein
MLNGLGDNILLGFVPHWGSTLTGKYYWRQGGFCELVDNYGMQVNGSIFERN